MSSSYIILTNRFKGLIDGRQIQEEKTYTSKHSEKRASSVYICSRIEISLVRLAFHCCNAFQLLRIEWSRRRKNKTAEERRTKTRKRA
jgi:hypothetical protein